MAKVTITFEDVDDGFTVDIASDPIIRQDEQITPAQEMALYMSQLVSKELAALEEHHVCESVETTSCCGKENCNSNDGCSGNCC